MDNGRRRIFVRSWIEGPPSVASASGMSSPAIAFSRRKDEYRSSVSEISASESIFVDSSTHSQPSKSSPGEFAGPLAIAGKPTSTLPGQTTRS